MRLLSLDEDGEAKGNAWTAELVVPEGKRGRWKQIAEIKRERETNGIVKSDFGNVTIREIFLITVRLVRHYTSRVPLLRVTVGLQNSNGCVPSAKKVGLAPASCVSGISSKQHHQLPKSTLF